jgi:tRNA(Glu) U13 pseudouridine synthase TruD
MHGLDKWQRTMDFSKVEVLHLYQDDTDFETRMRDELPNLHTFSTRWSYQVENSTIQRERVEFVRHLPPLKNLVISVDGPYYGYLESYNSTRAAFPLQSILERHGTTLDTLTLTHQESYYAGSRRPVLTVNELKSIVSVAPQLRSLVLDIDRNGT